MNNLSGIWTPKLNCQACLEIQQTFNQIEDCNECKKNHSKTVRIIDISVKNLGFFGEPKPYITILVDGEAKVVPGDQITNIKEN